jgi:hypothetical protein
MRSRLLLGAGIVLGALLWVGVAQAQAQAQAEAQVFVIVVNHENPVKAITIGELRRVFMKQTRMWAHGEAMVPVDWDSRAPIREAFSRQVLNRSVREMGEFWVRQTITQGLAPPSTQRSARAVRRFVASVVGAISYLPPDEADETVKVVTLTGR